MVYKLYIIDVNNINYTVLVYRLYIININYTLLVYKLYSIITISKYLSIARIALLIIYELPHLKSISNGIVASSKKKYRKII